MHGRKHEKELHPLSYAPGIPDIHYWVKLFYAINLKFMIKVFIPVGKNAGA